VLTRGPISRAVEYVAQRVEETGIECDLRRAPAFTCAVDVGQLGTIREEAQAAGEAGLPVETVTEAPLPFEIAGAVRLDDQIAFHPQRYVNGLQGSSTATAAKSSATRAPCPWTRAARRG
jgi:hypothetical protein